LQNIDSFVFNCGNILDIRLIFVFLPTIHKTKIGKKFHNCCEEKLIEFLIKISFVFFIQNSINFWCICL